MGIKIHATDRDGTPRNLEWEEDQTLMEVLRDNDLSVLASCGGTGSCGTCHVHLDRTVSEQLPVQQRDELELLENLESYRSENSRLSCQISHNDQLDGIHVELASEE